MDYGMVNNFFLIGGKLKCFGFFNEGLNLSILDKGDLIYKVDFCDIYVMILDKWLEGNFK